MIGFRRGLCAIHGLQERSVPRSSVVWGLGFWGLRLAGLRFRRFKGVRV